MKCEFIKESSLSCKKKAKWHVDCVGEYLCDEHYKLLKEMVNEAEKI